MFQLGSGLVKVYSVALSPLPVRVLYMEQDTRLVMGGEVNFGQRLEVAVGLHQLLVGAWLLPLPLVMANSPPFCVLSLSLTYIALIELTESRHAGNDSKPPLLLFHRLAQWHAEKTELTQVGKSSQCLNRLPLRQFSRIECQGAQ